MRKTILLAIDHEFDLALRPPLHILAAVDAGLAKAELVEQHREVARFRIAHGEFDETNTPAARLRLQPSCGNASHALTKSVFK